MSGIPGDVDPIDAYFDIVDQRLEEISGTVLKPRLDALEADRRHVRGYITKIVIVAALPLLAYFVSGPLQAPLMPHYETSPVARFLIDWWTEVFIALEVLALVFIGVAFVPPGLVAQLEYRRKFKQTVGTEIFKALVPDGAYQPDHHISQKSFDESGLFSGNYSQFRGDDLIRGRAGRIEYEASEIKAHGRFIKHRRRENQHASSTPNVTEFHGEVFHFGLPHGVNGHTIVEPEDCEGRMPGHRQGFDQIAISANDDHDDGDAFRKCFRVYTTDAAEARQILNARVRKRLMTLYRNHLTSVPFLSFVRNHAYVAVHAGRNRLEPTIAKPAGYAETSGLATFFSMPALLVRELELDGSGAPTGSPFTSTVFASSPFSAAAILSQAPAATFGTLDLAQPITASNVFDAAMPEADDQDAAHTPASTRVTLSPSTGDSFEATYGINPAFYVRILWTLALLPFVAAGFARLAGTAGAALHAAIVERVPRVTIVGDWAVEYPFAFVPLALLFYVLPAWTMTQIPRGVRIDREGMTVRRRIWPLPRRIRMDGIAGVKVSEQQVYIQRTKTAFLRRWVSAAPMLKSNEEAKWLGAHLRRALKLFGGLRES